MLKRYLRCRTGTEFWRENWRNLEPDPVRVDRRLVRTIEKYLPSRSGLLEGGCGVGDYLVYFSDRGYVVVGLDYVETVVERLVAKGLRVVLGDISMLPFEDDSFDGYYSGGVVEHFEAGPDRALQEAHRVLRPGGYLFVTVPNFNVARKLAWRKGGIYTDLDGRESLIRLLTKGCSIETWPMGWEFHEYQFARQEMRGFLQRSGFKILDELSFSAMWGLRDLRTYHKLARPGMPNRSMFNRFVSRLAGEAGRLDQSELGWAFPLSNFVNVVFGHLRLYIAQALK